jgi:hypothetical protein
VVALGDGRPAPALGLGRFREGGREPRPHRLGEAFEGDAISLWAGWSSGSGDGLVG